MESDGEDLDNIFEEYENTENDGGADDAENVQTTETSAVKVPVPKRIVKNPRLKFNPERLCGERGIPVLADHFKNVKFKGVGHEKEDLDKLLSKLEHWTHRLFPSMKFDDCLQQIEKLGKKRPVQTCLRKMRLNMPILSSDFINEEEDNVQRNDDPEPVEVDAFDRLIEESQDVINSSVPTAENSADSNFMQSPPIQSSYGIGHVLGSTSDSSLTEEQKKRMERNRMLAAERRKARLAALQQNSTESQSVSDEIIASKVIASTQEKYFVSSAGNPENASSIAHYSVMELSPDNNESVKHSSELNNKNSEALGLDDLIDLVDEKPVSDKNSESVRNHENAPSIADDSLVEHSHDNKNENMKKSSELNIDNSESLGLEDLMDLVDEEPISDKNSESVRNHENAPSITDDSLMEHSHDNNNESMKESPELNTENSEALGLEDLVDEEPISDKNSESVSSDKLKIVPNNVKKNGEFSQNNTSQVDFENCEQNVGLSDNTDNDLAISDNTDNDMAISDKICETENEDNLEIQPLLDLVNENSEDGQPITDPCCLVKNTALNDAEQENLFLDSNQQLTTTMCQN